MTNEDETNRLPRTPAEWQEAVDWASYLLALDAARQYGLINCGMKIDAERCDVLLAEGGAKGYQPAPFEVLADRFKEAILGAEL